MSDYEPAQIWKETRRKARKRYVCESGLYIEPGAEYVSIRYLFDGRWTTLRIHPDFHAFITTVNGRSRDYDDMVGYENWADEDWSREDTVELYRIYARNGMNMTHSARLNMSHRMDRLKWEKEMEEMRAERDALAARLDDAEIILWKISSGYWRVILNDAADGWAPGDAVQAYWEKFNLKGKVCDE